ncbi:transcriptional regulator [Flexivirga meconopsidis]|uniref:winged helix-turn-helix domain-containing protein n=1 Tax=Flexivirga meconopsidis TaxID=2977121 RepID=UPI0031343B0F
MTHPRHRLNSRIHTPVRFSLMAALAATGEAEFKVLRDTLEVSESLLSQHIRVLEDAGYVHVRKGYVGKRPRTWLSLTPEGNAAFGEHCAALRAITTTSVTSFSGQAGTEMPAAADLRRDGA